MPAQAECISVVCTTDETPSAYSFLSPAYTLHSFSSADQAMASEEFFRSQTVLIDVIDPNVCIRILNSLSDEKSVARVIHVWDIERMIIPEQIPKVYYFIRKPFTEANLSNIIKKAMAAQYTHEKRREPRIPVDLPIELICNARLFKTSATNLSIHGMQAIWPEKTSLAEIIKSLEQGGNPVSACRLFLPDKAGTENDHINILFSLRYVTDMPEKPVLMGFEFGDLDLDLRMMLYKAVTDVMEERPD